MTSRLLLAPAAQGDENRQMVGAMNRDLDTAAEGWTFFQDKRAEPAVGEQR